MLQIHGVTPLISASAKGDARIVRISLEKGANINTNSANGITPLWMVAYVGLMRELICVGVWKDVAVTIGLLKDPRIV